MSKEMDPTQSDPPPDDEEGSGGVREPRRPRPKRPSGAMELVLEESR